MNAIYKIKSLLFHFYFNHTTQNEKLITQNREYANCQLTTKIKMSIVMECSIKKKCKHLLFFAKKCKIKGAPKIIR